MTSGKKVFTLFIFQVGLLGAAAGAGAHYWHEYKYKKPLSDCRAARVETDKQLNRIASRGFLMEALMGNLINNDAYAFERLMQAHMAAQAAGLKVDREFEEAQGLLIGKNPALRTQLYLLADKVMPIPNGQVTPAASKKDDGAAAPSPPTIPGKGGAGGSGGAAGSSGSGGGSGSGSAGGSGGSGGGGSTSGSGGSAGGSGGNTGAAGSGGSGGGTAGSASTTGSGTGGTTATGTTPSAATPTTTSPTPAAADPVTTGKALTIPVTTVSAGGPRAAISDTSLSAGRKALLDAKVSLLTGAEPTVTVKQVAMARVLLDEAGHVDLDDELDAIIDAARHHDENKAKNGLESVLKKLRNP